MMPKIKRRKSCSVAVGPVTMGGGNPVVIQSMTDTPTANIPATLRQTKSLITAGAEIVRWTINDEAAAEAAPAIIQKLRETGYHTPIIGDFHFNGHILLSRYPGLAKSLDKYRINPGNIGTGRRHDENFRTCIKIAADHNKPVRIGVNSGSLDKELFTALMARNAKRKKTKNSRDITGQAMIDSALKSASLAEKFGLSKNKIVLSVKMSELQDMVKVYQDIARQSSYALHLGLTEAGSDLEGIIASTASLAILLQQGIGDTIRVSLTPQNNRPRTEEVRVCRLILQALGLRYFVPKVVSCPGCGRTNSTDYQTLAGEVKTYVNKQMPLWKNSFPGVEKLTIAVMGCIVNGPGESRHADIGISLPGITEKRVAPVYLNGQQYKILKGPHIAKQFLELLSDYIADTYTPKPARQR